MLFCNDIMLEKENVNMENQPRQEPATPEEIWSILRALSAERQGLYVIRAAAGSASIINEGNFQPRVFY